jgi:hypothetical protein
MNQDLYPPKGTTQQVVFDVAYRFISVSPSCVKLVVMSPLFLSVLKVSQLHMF